jgi:hypothetical protein
MQKVLFDPAIFDPGPLGAGLFDESAAGVTTLDATKKSWGLDWRRVKSPTRVVYDRVR